MERNRTFDFYRFLFACVIFIFHGHDMAGYTYASGAFSGGYLGVEFFFLLSGFLMAQSIEREKQESSAETRTLCYFIGRWKQLMPQYWLSIGLAILVRILLNPNFDVRQMIAKEIPEFFALQIFWKPVSVNGALWYVSALLWAGALVHYLVSSKHKFFVSVFFPLGLLTYCGWAFMSVGNIDIIDSRYFFLGGFLRAFFEIGFGCSLYSVYKLLKRYQIKLPLMSIIEFVTTAVIFFVMWRTQKDHKDFIMIFIMAAFVLAIAIGQGVLSKYLNNDISKFLGSISYPVYLNHVTFQWIAQTLFPGHDFLPTLAITFGVTVFYAVLTNLWFGRKKHIYWDKVSHFFIEKTEINKG